MDNIVITNKNKDFGEILSDVDFGSFKYEYEKNNERSISFKAYKTNENWDLFNMIQNENLLIWKSQTYIIKLTELGYENGLVFNDIVAKHIFMEFQNHYIEKNIESESLNDDQEEDKNISYTLKEYLDFGFKNNHLGFTYEIKGKFKNRVEMEELGDKNGLEYLIEGSELFGYVYYANNKHILIYNEDDFYVPSDEVLIYKYNNDYVKVKTTTTDLKTIIKGYGKKKNKTETKNYAPFKPKDLNYSSAFIKDGTWRTEEIGASYSKEFECKHGNEQLEWTLKKMSKGGMLEVYIDGKNKGQFDCYSKNAETKKIIIASGLEKGKHTFKAIFRGPKNGIDYKNSKPCMYVGTSKSTVLNLTAILKGSDVYYTSAQYKSPNYEKFGHIEAETVYDDNATIRSQLLDVLKQNLNDEPTFEVETNYLGVETINENNTIRFIHKPLNFNTDLKVVSLTLPHPLTNQPSEVGFSNSGTDIIKIQQQMNRNVSNFNNFMKKGFNSEDKTQSLSNYTENYSDVVGSVLIDE